MAFAERSVHLVVTRQPEVGGLLQRIDYSYDADAARFTALPVAGPGWPPTYPWEWQLRGVLKLDPADEPSLFALVDGLGCPLLALPPNPEALGLSGSRIRSYRSASQESFTMADVILSVRLLRALARDWVARAEGRPTMDEWHEEGFPVVAESVTLNVFAAVISEQLLRLAPRLDVVSGDEPQDPSEFPTLAEAVANEYLTMAEEKRPVRRCANEACRIPFIRREPVKGQTHNRPSRSKYCSERCANQQRSRENRRSHSKSSAVRGLTTTTGES